MNKSGMLTYVESEGKAQPLPFDRYLPPTLPGVAVEWVGRHTAPGDWILEPIGASPAAVLELAEAGYKVLVAINNPVAAFELSMLAQAPSKSELLSALRELGAVKKGSERLETHIQNLYSTRCGTCGREVFAECFLWRKAEPAPYAKVYRCPACGDEGEHPAEAADIEKLNTFKRSDPLHRSRALERLPAGTRSAQINVEELVSFYGPRPLYAIFTLINKLEGLTLAPASRACLDALLLSTLDAGHCLWPAGGDLRERPRALNVPAEYVEWNLWMALEKAVSEWSLRKKSIPLTRWPELPPSKGICLYQGRMRDLQQQKIEQPPKLIYCVLPRPNQVFWSLATLWASWLWGKENAANFKNVLERQRFDWYWHANALHSALSPASRMVNPNSKALCLLPEPAPGFVSSTFEACSAANLQLAGISWKDENHPILTEWNVQTSGREVKKVNLHRILHEAIHDALSETGEPCRYLKLFTAANVGLADNEAFPSSIPQLTYETVNEIHGEINKTFSDRKFLRRLDATAQELESGAWWLAQAEGCQQSLADRVETEIANWLQKDKIIPAAAVQKTLNARFQGLLTPSDELVCLSMQSYADLNKDSNQWELRPNEDTGKRSQDLAEIRELLEKLAQNLGFTTDGENPMVWRNQETLYHLYCSISGSLSRMVYEETDEETERLFIFPGSRSALLRYKIDRDPALRERVAHDWHFLKFRTLRELAHRKDISRDLWDLLIDSDPISLEDATQLSMFL